MLYTPVLLLVGGSVMFIPVSVEAVVVFWSTGLADNPSSGVNVQTKVHVVDHSRNPQKKGLSVDAIDDRV